jgi:hypothetical protein
MNNPTLVDKVKAMAALACFRGLTPAALRVGIRLLHHYNCGTGRCDPGIKTLASSTGMSERSAQRAVGELEALNLFHVNHRRGRRNTNSYRPDFKRIKAHNTTHATGLADVSLEDSRNLTAGTHKPDKLSRKNLTAVSGEHMNEHVNKHVKEYTLETSPERQSNRIEPTTNFAQQRNQQARGCDPKSIDWASWFRWLGSIGVPDAIQQIMDGIERVQTEAHLNFDQANLLVDQCLRKMRATHPSNKPLERLLTEAIVKHRSSL